MMAHLLTESIPDVDALLAIEPEELGAIVLEALSTNVGAGNHGFLSVGMLMHGLFGPHPGQDAYPSARKAEVELALREAWNWLEREGFLVQHSEGNPTYRRISRRGEKYRTASDIEGYRRAASFPRTLLHDRIREKVWSMWIRSEHDTAVFQAFKEVEVAVREACGWPADNDHLGVKLMRRAFKPTEGPLTDKTAEPGEQQALYELFAGAIGSYKNPHSHRHVALTAEEAAEMLILATHLLRIVEARAPGAAACA